MVAQVSKRKIGNVTVVDIKGAFTGPWAIRSQNDLKFYIDADKTKKLVFNLRPATEMDSLGAKIISRFVPKDGDIGFFLGDPQMMRMVERYLEHEPYHVFRNEREVVAKFGDALVESEGKEQRQFPRLKTALPIRFYKIGDDRKTIFRAVVTNLSMGGLYAEYIDLKHAEETLQNMNPNDLSRIHLHFSLPTGRAIDTMGKVAYANQNEEQVGIGVQFESLSEKDQMELNQYLNEVS